MEIIYKQVRIGLKGKPFTMWKFRTMVVGADRMGGPSTAADDPRLTKIGKFLKKYQIDELPQLWNILKRDMNLVGPRPEVKQYIDMMSQKEKDVILSVRPGLTDLATLANMSEGERLRGKADPEKAYMEDIRPEKIRLQIEYVKTRSWWLDIKIIGRTLWRIIH